MNVKDKVVIVTGASSGIGKATAKLLSEKGAKVVLAARSKEKLNKISKELANSFVVAADMSKEAEIKGMVKKVLSHFGKVNILINNAGRGYDATVEQLNIKKYQELIALNVIGPIIAMQAVLPIMKKQKSGMIINISSGTALMNIPGISAYSSTKRALTGISVAAREELKDTGVVVSIVYPFITATDFYKNKLSETTETDDDNWYLKQGDSPEFVAEKILEAIRSEEAEIFAHDRMKKL